MGIDTTSPCAQIVLEPRAAYAPGDEVVGHVEPAAAARALELVSWETTPEAVFVRLLDAVELPAGAASSALELPAGLPPTACGTDCEIGYAIRLRGDGGRPLDVAAIVVEPAPQRVRRETHWPDRMLATVGARRFHLELSEARLEGGGRVAGRVHRDGDAVGSPLTVRVRCLECWRLPRPALGFTARTGPWWERRVLWECALPVVPSAERRWNAFACELPAGLPPSVEGYAFAWRYEVTATRRRLLAQERAVVTPVLYEAPGTGAGGGPVPVHVSPPTGRRLLV